ncbi:hypothetical protein L0Y49_00780 [bacterium]|nr:hypothetical protein [bacterium]MCI0679861.1 hypothetical protein [bacterium]
MLNFGYSSEDPAIILQRMMSEAAFDHVAVSVFNLDRYRELFKKLGFTEGYYPDPKK